MNFENILQVASQLSQLNEETKNHFLLMLSQTLEKNKTQILNANEKDIKKAQRKNVSEAFIQRLMLDKHGIEALQNRLLGLQKLKSGVGSVLEKRTLPNGITLKKVSVPIGVVVVVYESRPEVTIDVAALCIKSGNAVILKGGSEALNTNKILFACIVEALVSASIPQSSVEFIEDRQMLYRLLSRNDSIDLVVARGGYKMVREIINRSNIPVLAHAAGGARIFVDKSANLLQAKKIIINAKTDKPSACNTLDTVLIHKEISDSFILDLVDALQKKSVVVLGDEYIHNLAQVDRETEWDREYLSKIISLKKVHDGDEAIQFVRTYSKKHSEGIIAQDKTVIKKFTDQIDAAAIFVNCSTRFHDGYEFGLGSEMGIATGKLHARGPVGLDVLTTYKWEAYGDGQTR